jgi:murein DD-endopeptidase MepM/ murein hydrolase activator NlpD
VAADGGRNTEVNDLNEKKTAGQRAADFLAGKGFYIVLLICAAVVAISAWALFFAGEKDDTSAVMSSIIDEETASRDEAAVVKATQKPEATPTAAPTDEPEATAAAQQDSEPVPTTEIEETSSTMESEPVAAVRSFVWPVSGTVQQQYAVEELIYSKTMADWRTHDGVDISAEIGTKVMAVSDGTVKEAYSDEMYGTTVVIDHGSGLCSVYSNLAATPTVSVGDNVSLGDVIGSVGTTAMAEVGEAGHLHYSMTLNGESVDPGEYLPAKN